MHYILDALHQLTLLVLIGDESSMFIEELPLSIDVPGDANKYEKTFSPVTVPVTQQATEYIALELLRRKNELDADKGARGGKVPRLLGLFNAARKRPTPGVIESATDGGIFEKEPPARGTGGIDSMFFRRRDSVPCLRTRSIVVPRHSGSMVDEQALEEEKERKRQERQQRQEQKSIGDAGEINDGIFELEGAVEIEEVGEQEEDLEEPKGLLEEHVQELGKEPAEQGGKQEKQEKQKKE